MVGLSQLLELTLTGKEGGKTIGRVPMAGIPHHAAERYCSELIKKGFSVAICDQLESAPADGKSLIKRSITRVITPGTVIEEGMLQARRNNWLGSVLVETFSETNEVIKWALAQVDVSTGEFLVREGEGKLSLEQDLLKIEASEVITEKNEQLLIEQWCPKTIHIKELEKTPFTFLEAETSLKQEFNLTTLKGLGIQSKPLALKAAGGLIAYLQKTNPTTKDLNKCSSSSSIPLNLPQLIYSKNALIIDAQTRRNLEITSTQKDGQFHGSLLWAIDRTETSMGSRCLRRWIQDPLVDAKKIKLRM